ncbi:peptidase S58 family protein [Corynebacterium sp. sy017]|uniref:P1 family peptidase n=1 Tax=unclassified Corynebacterium TaxID=2624378 RepID=UPI0011858112|nr:P1 family peptidase [Corynebacterium sp. SY003]MBP3088172.1 peptidase S58 family protein [Corynebacterium sp. sy017]TSD92780.1 peptidase S58 family protein [Corynebacterium sp. SY003]
MGATSEVAGIYFGHTSLGSTGCTAVVAPESAICAVDVRGGGPGTRETDLLRPENTVQRVHAVLLCGGSAYGLAAADGATCALEEAHIGFPVIPGALTTPIVPIVPAAVIFDLLVGDSKTRPQAQHGYDAVQAALSVAAGKQEQALPEHSCFGAGCGATAGVLKGGIGISARTVGGWTLSAIIVANPVGSVINPTSGTLWAAQECESVPVCEQVDIKRYAQLKPLASKLNTTIGVVLTDAPLTNAQAKRLAMVGHDGIAIAIRPAHSPLDGDTLFCMSTGSGQGVSDEDMYALSSQVASVVAQAIVSAVRNAQPGYEVPAYRELLL